jgi:uncharacterized protein YktA (UPF0223 family)
MFFRRGQDNTPKVLTDMQKRYEAETGSTMFSKPPSSQGGRFGNPQNSKDKKAYEQWSKTTAGMDSGKNRFNEMMANRSQNPVLGQTQAGMSGFDQFQAMQAAKDNPQLMQSEGSELLSILLPDRAREISAANDVRNQQAGYDRFQAMQAGRNVPTLSQPSSVTASGTPGMLQAAGDIIRTEQINAAQGGKLNQAGYDRFQAMQAARDSANYNVDGSSLPRGVVSWADLENGSLENKIRAYNTGQRSEQGARFNAAMGANPLILQQLQMGQRQMGPQFNAFGFGAQPGLAAQGGQGGSMLANMSNQGMNQLAAGQQNNPTIFKAKS